MRIKIVRNFYQALKAELNINTVINFLVETIAMKNVEGKALIDFDIITV